MMGDIVPSPDEALVGQVRGLRQVLDSLKDIKKVFIPPVPRYVYGGCCATKHHAPNTSAPDHPVKMLAEHIRQRHTITKALFDSQATHFKVTDILGIFTALHDSLTEKARKICTFMHKDNVHRRRRVTGSWQKKSSLTSTSSPPSSRAQPNISGPPRLRPAKKRCGGALEPPEAQEKPQQHPSGAVVAPATTPIGDNRVNRDFLSPSPLPSPYSTCELQPRLQRRLTIVIFRYTRYLPHSRFPQTRRV